MLMKSLSADAGKQNATGTTRRHIITRFQKAHRYAIQLVKLLQDPASNSSKNDILEAKAYAASLAGAIALEKRQWQSALTQFSTSRVVYSALLTDSRSDVFKELLTSSIDPSVRYSAYQNQLSRSLDVPTISRQHFSKLDETLVTSVKELDPSALKEEEDSSASGDGAAVVNSVTWRGRTAPVQEAEVASALGNVQTAEKALQSYLESHAAATGRDQAGEFDEILAAWQESVDVTKKAIDDMVSEGVNSGDEKLQALQLTFTYVNYNLISWRIRRNRVMAKGLVNARIGKTSKLSALKEELALWDAILQVRTTIFFLSFIHFRLTWKLEFRPSHRTSRCSCGRRLHQGDRGSSLVLPCTQVCIKRLFLQTALSSDIEHTDECLPQVFRNCPIPHSTFQPSQRFGSLQPSSHICQIISF